MEECREQKILALAKMWQPRGASLRLNPDGSLPFGSSESYLIEYRVRLDQGGPSFHWAVDVRVGDSHDSRTVSVVEERLRAIKIEAEHCILNLLAKRIG